MHHGPTNVLATENPDSAEPGEILMELRQHSAVTLVNHGRVDDDAPHTGRVQDHLQMIDAPRPLGGRVECRLFGGHVVTRVSVEPTAPGVDIRWVRTAISNLERTEERGYQSSTDGIRVASEITHDLNDGIHRFGHAHPHIWPADVATHRLHT